MKQKCLIALIILVNIIECKSSTDNSILEGLSILFLRKDRVTISGNALKGIMKSADVNIHKLNSDGTCDLNSNLGTAVTDDNGNYSITYNKGNGVVCVRVQPSRDGTSTIFDEKTKAFLPISSLDFNLINIFSEAKLINISRTNNSISPFSKMMSRRFSNLMQSPRGSQTPRSLSQRASKEVVIRFGLNSGLATANSRNIDLLKNTAATSITGNNFPELIDLNLDFRNMSDPFTAKSVAILSGFSQLASQFKGSSTVTSNDIDSIVESFSKDFEDGIFDGKDSSGKQVFIGTGSKQIAMPSDSITNLLLPAIKAFFAEGGTLNIGQRISSNVSNASITPATSALNQIQFLDSIPIIFPTGDSFSIGGTVSDLYTAGLVLQNNAGEEIIVSHSVGAPKTFTFNTRVSNYAVSVKTQPIATNCSVINGTGTATADVTNVAVSCLTLVGNGVLRPLTGLGNTVTTLAGSTGGYVDAIGTAAQFNDPEGVATDGENIYVSHTANAGLIRKIVIATGSVTTIATAVGYPVGLTILGPNLYAAGYTGFKILKIGIATGVTTILAGAGTGFNDGIGASALFTQPEAITTDGKDLYVFDNKRIRKIVIDSATVTTIAGSASAGFADGIGTAATFTSQLGITSDGTNLYVIDAFKIRKIVIATAVVTTIAGDTVSGYLDGTGALARFSSGAYGIHTDGANLYIGDTGNNRIRKVVISTGVVTTLAGQTSSGTTNGIGAAAQFNGPRYLTSDGINLFIDDQGNNRIRRLQ